MQHARRVRTPAGKPRRHRDFLFDCNFNPGIFNSRFFKKRLRRFISDIALVFRDTFVRRADNDFPGSRLGAVHFHRVAAVHRLHNHKQAVIAVGQRAENIEHQIDFCGRFNFHIKSFLLHPEKITQSAFSAGFSVGRT